MSGGAFSTADLIERIRRREQLYGELRQSHHFVFDCPLDATHTGAPAFVWLGVNPGSDKGDFQLFPKRTEETREFDWQRKYGRSAGSKGRMRQLREFLGPKGFGRTTHSALFFWCSANTREAFKSRYGYSFKDNPHWDFCCEINLALVERAYPMAVMAEGRGWIRYYEDRFRLQPGCEHRDSAGEILIEERRFRNGIPLYCFDHLSALGKAIQRRPKVKAKLATLLAECG